MVARIEFFEDTTTFTKARRTKNMATFSVLRPCLPVTTFHANTYYLDKRSSKRICGPQDQQHTAENLTVEPGQTKGTSNG